MPGDPHPPEAARPRLAQWLGERLGALHGTRVTEVALGEFAVPAVGQSSDTVFFSAEWREEGRRESGQFVMKRRPDGDRIFLDADVLDEHRVLAALQETPGVPVPPLIGAYDGPEVLGTGFFVMARVPGTIPAGKPSIHTAGWLPTLAPRQRERLWRSALDALVAVHRTDWRRSHAFLAGEQAGAGGLERHLERFGRWYRWARAGRSFPVTDAAWRYLVDNRHRVPSSEPVLLWGDARPGNMIFDSELSVAAVIDWEVAGVGPPEVDVAHWLVFDELATPPGVARLPGVPDRADTLAYYAQRTGRTLHALEYFEVLQGLFVATTLIRQADLAVAAGRLVRGTRMGHDNTMTQGLARRLGLPVPELSADYLKHRTPAGPAG
ncbi:phosphotransferase family protein [Streptomyces sulphureus]|uniref:phosphotransferase family protein n=1 Tax=Streptomyces sulphureus TaxID=47758 RepID=UPI00036E5028|nr:phosphotransferase family protein [Streptomyces sulphureus]